MHEMATIDLPNHIQISLKLCKTTNHLQTHSPSKTLAVNLIFVHCKGYTNMLKISKAKPWFVKPKCTHVLVWKKLEDNHPALLFKKLRITVMTSLWDFLQITHIAFSYPWGAFLTSCSLAFTSVTHKEGLKLSSWSSPKARSHFRSTWQSFGKPSNACSL